MSHGLRLAAVALALSCLLAGCTDPPDKEINQAKGAIAAARAAGADQYARDEYEAAVAALGRSEDAVAQRDYRQALNYALDSRERAQNAARRGADQKALARSEAERGAHDLQTAIIEVRTRLKAADSARPRRRDLEQPRLVIDDATAVLNDAREALERGEYRETSQRTTTATAQVREAIRQIDAVLSAAQGRKKR
jgi:hypothetical protein